MALKLSHEQMLHLANRLNIDNDRVMLMDSHPIVEECHAAGLEFNRISKIVLVPGWIAKEAMRWTTEGSYSDMEFGEFIAKLLGE